MNKLAHGAVRGAFPGAEPGAFPGAAEGVEPVLFRCGTRVCVYPPYPLVLPPPELGLSTLLGIQELAYENGSWLIPYSGRCQTDAERWHPQKRSPSCTRTITRRVEPPLADLPTHPRPACTPCSWFSTAQARTWARGRSSPPSGGVRAHLTPPDPQKELSHVHDH